MVLAGPWKFGEESEGVIRSYINARYKLMPSLIAAGQHATRTGLPLAARCDTIWPEHAATGAANATQYIFLQDTLVAPIWTDAVNTRSVWVPPGEWEDAWDGSTVSGPKIISVTQPPSRQPMWHRKDGALTVMTDTPGLRVEDGDWSTLTLEAWAAQTEALTERSLFALRTEARTDLAMRTDGAGAVAFSISASTDGAERAWVVRLHLRPGQRVTSAELDGAKVPEEAATHLEPLSEQETAASHFPFGGQFARPPTNAGAVAELRLPPAAHPRELRLRVA